MKHMIIDGISCGFDNERSVLEVALKNHIDIPHLCYCEKLSVYGGCRICVVETDKGGIEAACSLAPQDGLSIRTNTAKLRKHRQMILELMLASHRADCTTCGKSGKCKLQAYAKRFGVTKVRFANEYSKHRPDTSSPALVRDPTKCILCGSCVRMCSELAGIGALEFAGRGKSTRVSCGFGRKLSDSCCVSCGLCASVCPTGALMIKNEVSAFWDAIYDSSKKVAVAVSPALGVPTGKLITALRTLGADYVFDISTAADLALTELSDELRASDKPLFTASCPAFVKYVENRHPELTERLSVCESPVAMMASIVRRQFGDEDIFFAAVMPCSAQKAEIKRPELCRDGERLIDLALTAEELGDILCEAGIDLRRLPVSKPDAPFDEYSEAGRLFAATGDPSRGIETLNGIEVRVVDGLPEFEELLNEDCSQYPLTVVKGCPGGCSGRVGYIADEPVVYALPDDNPAMFEIESLIRFGRKALLRVDRTGSEKK